MTTINTEVSRYNEEEFSKLVRPVAWMEKYSYITSDCENSYLNHCKNEYNIKFQEIYNKYFTENYLESVLAWRVFFHSMVKKQKAAKKIKTNDGRSIVLRNRETLHFLHLMRMYGKECYKKSIQQ